MSLNAIGLGEMTVKSSLDQPFLAEIELIDVGNAPLMGIKVGVADPESFHQIGLERIAVLSLLNFKIEQNAKGKLVIKIQSVDRISDPYMELVVDLTWPNGQLYKAYTVLVDPPGYQLVSTLAQNSPAYYKKMTGHKKVAGHRAQSGVINKKVITEVQHNPVALKDNKKKTTYGPTITNENVWQIAQRYKTSEVILPQVVLAVVGENPDAFKEGNLNGLKIGIRLVIPSTREIMEVPAELATEEVMAHDKAWDERSSINHVLSPPYINGQTINTVPRIATNYPIKKSEVPAIPRFTTMQAITPPPAILPQFLIPNSAVSVMNSNQQPAPDKTAQNPERVSNIKAEISITTAAVESVRESNAILMEQLHLLQEQNKKLQLQLDKRDKEIESIQAQMQLMVKQRLAVASQANASFANNQSSSLWPLWILLVLAVGGGSFAYWYFIYREKDIHDEPYLVRTPMEPPSLKPEAQQKLKKADETTELSAAGEDVGVVEQNETASKSSKVEEIKPKVIAESSKKIINDNDLSDKKMINKSESVETADKPVKKQGAKKKKNAVPKKAPIEAADLPIGKQEAFNERAVLIPGNKETTGKDKKQKDKIARDIKEDQEAAKEKSVMEFESQKNHLPVNDEVQNLPPSDQNPLLSGSESISEQSENKAKEESSNHDVLEFETDLHQLIPEKSEKKTKPKSEQEDGSDQSIDFVSTSSNPLKSKTALNTLLALAKTYIGMDDIESARTSLEEVLEYGNEIQKTEAQRLLDEIKDK